MPAKPEAGVLNDLVIEVYEAEKEMVRRLRKCGAGRGGGGCLTQEAIEELQNAYLSHTRAWARLMAAYKLRYGPSGLKPY